MIYKQPIPVECFHECFWHEPKIASSPNGRCVESDPLCPQFPQNRIEKAEAKDHLCEPPCPDAAEQLRELVEAAGMWVALDQDVVPLEEIFAVEERLDAELAPFREKT